MSENERKTSPQGGYAFFTLINGIKAVKCNYSEEEAALILAEAARYRLKKEVCDCDDHGKMRKMGKMQIDAENILVENGHFCGCIFSSQKLLVKNIGKGERVLVDVIPTSMRGDSRGENYVYVSLC